MTSFLICCGAEKYVPGSVIYKDDGRAMSQAALRAVKLCDFDDSLAGKTFRVEVKDAYALQHHAFTIDVKLNGALGSNRYIGNDGKPQRTIIDVTLRLSKGGFIIEATHRYIDEDNGGDWIRPARPIRVTMI